MSSQATRRLERMERRFGTGLLARVNTGLSSTANGPARTLYLAAGVEVGAPVIVGRAVGEAVLRAGRGPQNVKAKVAAFSLWYIK